MGFNSGFKGLKNQVAGVSAYPGQVHIVSYIHTDTRFFVLHVQGPYFIPLLLVATSCRLIYCVNLSMTNFHICECT